MKKHTGDSRRLQLAGQKQHYELLMRRGHQEIATDYARKVGLAGGLARVGYEDDLVGDDDILGDVPRVKSASRMSPDEVHLSKKQSPALGEMVNGWPVRTVGVVWATCPNPMLVVLKLPDGRTASMLREGLGGAVMGVRVNAVLKKPQGDPIYAWVGNHEDQSDVPATLVDIAAGTPSFQPVLNSGRAPVLIG